MEYKHMCVVAKKIASILAENEATVSDLPEIYKKVKDYLVVTACFPKSRSRLGEIIYPDHADDGDRIGDE